MSRIISYTPPWLSRPSPGFEMFTRSPETLSNTAGNPSSSSKRSPYMGHRRTIARRGTELFVVAGNTIRWADLPTLKYDFEETDEINGSPSGRRGQKLFFEENSSPESQFKTLKPAVHEPIQQIVPSPNGELLAIVTAHTVHIAILPDSTYLSQPDSGPIRVKTHSLGPTIHVLTQSQVVEALWHPLGVAGQCLVTVTADAVVRLWELNRDNRWSYDKPTLDFDLTRLHHAFSAEDNVAPANIGENKGFSLDSLGMEVASAKFGGTGSEDEQGWSSMTLWIAMTEGDVYALCPLLPSKWQSHLTQIPSLTTSVVAKKAYAEGPESHEELQRIFEAQFQWLAEIDEQDPMVSDDNLLIYNRPRIQGSLPPRLQGPFRIQPGDLEDDLELSDIHIIAPKLDTEDLLGSEEYNRFDSQELGGLSSSMICLITTSGRVYACLNLEEIEGQWLPLKKPKAKQISDPESQPELVLLEGLETARDLERHTDSRPVFTPDALSQYSFFVTHGDGVFYFSLQPWLLPLEKELQAGNSTGATFRMGVLGQSAGTVRNRIYHFNTSSRSASSSLTTASLVFYDSDLSYFLLTTFNNQPKGAVLDIPEHLRQVEYQEAEPSLNFGRHDVSKAQIVATEIERPRHPFEPPAVLWEHKTALSNFMENSVNGRHRAMYRDGIRLSSATLEVMTEAHRVISQETHVIGLAASEMFARCSTLQRELQNQIKRVVEIRDIVDKINDDDADDYDEAQAARGSEKLEKRFLAAKEKQEALATRLEILRKKLSQGTAKPLSKAESRWVDEVGKTAQAIMPDEMNAQDGNSKEVWQRYEEVKDLVDTYLPQAKDVNEPDDVPDINTNNIFRIPSDVRKNKLKQVMDLLERETALVDAAQERLGRLSLVGA